LTHWRNSGECIGEGLIGKMPVIFEGPEKWKMIHTTPTPSTDTDSHEEKLY
jgi:hypothetical protein